MIVAFILPPKQSENRDQLRAQMELYAHWVGREGLRNGCERFQCRFAALSSQMTLISLEDPLMGVFMQCERKQAISLGSCNTPPRLHRIRFFLAQTFTS